MTIKSLKADIDELDEELKESNDAQKRLEEENSELREQLKLYEKEIIKIAELNEQLLQEKKAVTDDLKVVVSMVSFGIIYYIALLGQVE